MKIVKKFFYIPELYCLFLLCVGVLLFFAFRFSLENIGYRSLNDERKATFPIAEQFREGERFEVFFDVRTKLGEAFALKVIPDDCAETVKINGNKISLFHFPGRCDYRNGFVLPLDSIAKYADGENFHFEFLVRNNGGVGGLNVKPEMLSSATGILPYVLMLASFTALFAFLFRRFHIRLLPRILLTAGVLLRALMFSSISYSQYSYDVDGHLGYIKIIAERHEIPGTDDCWTCYHPPVYYAVSSVPWLLGSALHFDGPSAVQLESLFLSIFVLFLGFKILETVLTKKTLVLGTLLWTFWPLLLLVAPRIGNDQLFYFFHTLCLWGVLEYIRSKSAKALLCAVVAAGLSYWTKSTGVVTLATFALGFVLGYFPREMLFPKKSEIVSLVLFILFCLGILGIRLYGDASLVGNASGLHSGLAVPNSLINYIYFDLKNYVLNPFTSPWDAALGREFFWNYALKSSLFGEFQILKSPLGEALATAIGISLLVLIVCAFRGFWMSKIDRIKCLLLFQILMFFGALICLRITVPFACSNDFRYILPVLVAFIPFVCFGISNASCSLKWKVLMVVNGIVFAGLSVWFVLLMLVKNSSF